MNHVVVWDIETIPDLKGFAAANGHDGKTDDDIRAPMGDKFPKHITRSYALAPWWLIRTVVNRSSTPLGLRTSASARKRR
jgi:hypothetical protein